MLTEKFLRQPIRLFSSHRTPRPVCTSHLLRLTRGLWHLYYALSLFRCCCRLCLATYCASVYLSVFIGSITNHTAQQREKTAEQDGRG